MVMLTGRMEINYRRFGGKGSPAGGYLFRYTFSRFIFSHMLIMVSPYTTTYNYNLYYILILLLLLLLIIIFTTCNIVYSVPYYQPMYHKPYSYTSISISM